jgi:hypothetical protein
VIGIAERLGPFQAQKPDPDNVKREVREPFTLENKARYNGEWSIMKNQRDGFGV